MKNLINSMIILSILVYLSVVLFELQYSNKHKLVSNTNTTSQREYDNLMCLVENIYYEAAGESLPGKIAVAQVTLSRVGTVKFGNSICSVVHAKNQFSWTIEKPKALIRINKKVFEDAKYVAKKVLFEGENVDCVGKSRYYHTTSILPRWDFSKLEKTCIVGSHIFYKDR